MKVVSIRVVRVAVDAKLGSFKMEQLMNMLGIGELYRMDKRQVSMVHDIY